MPCVDARRGPSAHESSKHLARLGALTDSSRDRDDRSRLSRVRPVRRRDLALLLGAFAIGCLWRLPGVGEALLFGDEFHTLGDIPQGYGHVLTHFSATGSGMALPLLQRIAFDLFGANHWTIRAPAWIPGLALLPAVWLIARQSFGDRIALGATWLVAVCPMLIFYSRFARAYAGVALLSLLLLDRVEAVLRDDARRRGRLATVALYSALLPWAHPTALAAVVPVVLAGALAAWLDVTRAIADRRRTALGLLGALFLGGVLCIALHLPAADSLREFVSAKTSQSWAGEFGWLDTVALVFGQRTIAATIVPLVIASAIALAWQRRRRALPLLAAVFGPVLVVAVVQPYGDAYAYARYGIAAVAPALVLLAFGIDRAFTRAASSFGAGAPFVTATLALGWLAVGPPGPFDDRAPQHANTYLALYPLPAFDAVWPDTPDFYRELAARPARERAATTLIELPALNTRTRHLYRHYQLQHGGRTLLAPLSGEFPLLPEGPYVSAVESGPIERSGADFIVVHLDVADELQRYWSFVYGQDGPPRPPDTAAYMARHSQYAGPLPAAPPRLLAFLAARYGEPEWRDDRIAVWRLPGAEARTPGSD